MAAATFCKACKAWHDPLLGCKRAAAMGQVWADRPGAVANVEPVRHVPVCAQCQDKAKLIDELRANIAAIEANKPANIAANSPANSVTQDANKANSRKEYMRAYMAKKRAKEKS